VEAFQAFTRGLAQRNRGDERGAIPLFRRAVELDPNFAAAHARLAALYSNLAQRKLGAESIKEAHERRDRVSERERFYIDYWYITLIDRDRRKAIETLERWSQIYPMDEIPHADLAVAFRAVGQSERAAEEARRALALDPNKWIAYQRLAHAYVTLGRLEEAKATYDKALAQKIDNSGFHQELYIIAVLTGDSAGALAQEELVKGTPTEFYFVAMQRHQAAAAGQFQRSRELLGRGMELSERYKLQAPAALAAATEAYDAALADDPAQARQQVAVALATSGDPVSADRAATALALVGDTAQAQAILEERVKKSPSDFVLNSITIPQVRAEIEMSQPGGDPGKALEALEAAKPYDRENVYVLYTRGMAFLRAKSGAQAAAEFQKVVDHRTIEPFSIVHPLAHLGLARAAALTGDVAGSRKAYQDFLALWKDADPDVPILKEAKSEYATVSK
jgi:tetratricopeptide (TPR) repeat protein